MKKKIFLPDGDFFKINPINFKVKKDHINISPLTKNKIEAIVKAYSELFPEEMKTVAKAIRVKEDTTDPGSFDPDREGMGRPIYEISETLTTMLINQLTEEELKEWRGYKASYWFANKFPMFSLLGVKSGILSFT